MAFCGTALPDEKKDAESDDDHSLDNIVAFSTKKKQMCAPCKEGLFIDDNGTPVDRRIKVCYDEEKFCSTSYSGTCQITAIDPQKRKGVGSACAVPAYDRMLCFITCAHNMVAWSSRTKSTKPFTKMQVYGMRDGEKNWHFLCNSIKKNIPHPKYNGQADCGFDLGLIVQTKRPSMNRGFQKFKPKPDSLVHFMNPKDVTEGMTIELIGYPGEKKGRPFTHTGEILDITESDLGGWVLWYNADATPGNSGSAIWLTDEKYVKANSKPGTAKLMIGIHTGYDDADGSNFGTLLTKSLESWIMKELDYFSK